MGCIFGIFNSCGLEIAMCIVANVFFYYAVKYNDNISELRRRLDRLNGVKWLLTSYMEEWTDHYSTHHNGIRLKPYLVVIDLSCGVQSRRCSVEELEDYITECRRYMHMGILQNIWHYRSSATSAIVDVKHPL